MGADSTSPREMELKQRLEALREEAARLEEEISAIHAGGRLNLSSGMVPTSTPRTPAEKVALFLDLFGTRRSVYPKRWENEKTNRSGYSPACDNEWRKGICGKPQVKCTECPHQKFPPLDARAVEMHLRGIATLGVYAITDESACRFVAADFDGEGWMENVAAYREEGAKVGVKIAVERSRSGNGAHAWIFFAEPLPAVLARKLGTLLLAKATAKRPGMRLETFDRFFPNQDTIPPGGFGNLIALPLAKLPRQAGNTLFLDESFRPYPDQWQYLAGLPRLSVEQVEKLIVHLSPLMSLGSGPVEPSDLVLQSEEATLDLSRPAIRSGTLAGELVLRVDSQIHIPRTVPIPVLAALKRLATFANPVFHEKLRLRFPTFDTPRFLFGGEWHTDRLVLPRGLLDAAVQILEDAGAEVQLQDHRETGQRCAWSFRGDLRTEQHQAVREMVGHDVGVLCAPPGSGKTVMGCALIARHRTSVLVLVHRAILLDQWKEAAAKFLGLKKREIGVWRGSKPRLTRRFDIAMLPSLSRAEDYAAVFAGYGFVIIDECHHVPATTFEHLLKACPSRRIIGLTATPYRKDKLERLLYLQCGPIRHTLRAKSQLDEERVVYVRRSSISLPQGPGTPAIHEIWDAIVADDARLQRIVTDIVLCLNEGRSPLVLADRKRYLDRLQAALAADPRASEFPRYRLESDVGKKTRSEIRSRIDAHYGSDEPFVLFATASLIGEGFDLPQLDTLVLAMPLSFKGRLIQYAGRLHRSHEGKASARIYDYLDDNNPMTRAMFQRRSAGYRQMEYRMEMEPDSPDGLFPNTLQRLDVARGGGTMI